MPLRHGSPSAHHVSSCFVDVRAYACVAINLLDYAGFVPLGNYFCAFLFHCPRRPDTFVTVDTPDHSGNLWEKAFHTGRPRAARQRTHPTHMSPDIRAEDTPLPNRSLIWKTYPSSPPNTLGGPPPSTERPHHPIPGHRRSYRSNGSIPTAPTLPVTPV